MTKQFLASTAVLVAVTAATFGPTPASAQESGDPYAAVDARLATLEGTRSPAELNRILTGGGAVQALVDNESGDVVAAFRATTRTLTPVSPGCTTTSACMTTSAGLPYGLAGSGTRTGSWKKIVRVAAGDRRTSYAASNGAAYNYSAGVSIAWKNPVTVVKVSR
ncbi:hypothetical protein [Curtobacterium sp. MCBD17_030]|uniref:hypothetical protein n=1 Tax=Curtobacterium sp. MCBD17_030 TaxID=2175649 RepID=UPI0011B53A42|nr:hypothetical protein [Curtobacterium sp. MCBD17_030]